MALPRRPLTSWATLLRRRPTTATRAFYARQTARQSRTRGYATEHGGAKKSSDLPWFLGSVAVTVPILWYIGIYQPDPNAHHGHDSHEGHGEGEDKDNESDSKEESSEESDEDSKDDEKDDDKEDKKDAKKGDKKGETNDDAKRDEASPSKPAGSSNSTSGKQEGVANADTKHSTDPANDPGKSDKPEGGPDTAKSKGTVDSKRKQK